MFCYVRNDSAGVTVHCALLSIKSKNLRIHFSKVFFVKGKGGRGRRGRLLQEVSAPRTNQRGGVNQRQKEPTQDTSRKKTRPNTRKYNEVVCNQNQKLRNRDGRQSPRWTDRERKPETVTKKHFSRLSILWFSRFLSFLCFLWFQNFLEK